LEKVYQRLHNTWYPVIQIMLLIYLGMPVAWSISAETTLWTGAGVVSGLVEDIYSGQTEAFGILSALWFLVRYIASLPIIIPQCMPIKVLCNNQGVIQCILGLQSAPFTTTRMTTSDDFDIFYAIYNIEQSLNPLQFNFVHIKGYQDHNHPLHQLSFEAQLNVEWQMSFQPSAKKSTPMLELPFPHPIHQSPIAYSWKVNCSRSTSTSLTCCKYTRLPSLFMSKVELAFFWLWWSQLEIDIHKIQYPRSSTITKVPSWLASSQCSKTYA